jgi:hypothetical protein
LSAPWALELNFGKDTFLPMNGGFDFVLAQGFHPNVLNEGASQALLGFQIGLGVVPNAIQIFGPLE